MIKFSIGQSAARVEDQRLLTGAGRYTDDSADPTAAQAFILRADHAHARINSINTANATGAPGVLAVYTGDDLQRDNIGDMPCLTELDNRDGTKLG